MPWLETSEAGNSVVSWPDGRSVPLVGSASRHRQSQRPAAVLEPKQRGNNHALMCLYPVWQLPVGDSGPSSLPKAMEAHIRLTRAACRLGRLAFLLASLLGRLPCLRIGDLCSSLLGHPFVPQRLIRIWFLDARTF